MAGFKVQGMEELNNLFAQFETIPYEVVWKMLDAEADVVVAEQRRMAETMLQGPHNKGAVKKAIKKGRIKLSKGAYVQYITFNGTQHGVRLAEIAFINNYGKKGQSARPFVTTANAKSEETAANAAADVLYDWIDSIN